MRVRVWINGADGPSRDFELISAPRVGERISIAHGGQTEEGVVDIVTWQLQAMEPNAADMGLDGEPTGSVGLVHVVCRPLAQVITGAFTGAEVDISSEAAGSA
jgi:hypothetical protein